MNPKPKHARARSSTVPAAQRSLHELLGVPKPADAWAAAGTHGFLDVGKVDENPANARRRYDEAQLDALAQSMRANGLIEPIVVRPVPKGRYELVAGSRRLRAAKKLGWKQIHALVRGGVTEAGVRSASAVENLQRADLTPYEEARAYQSLLDKGLTQDQVAAACAVGVTTVKNRLQLLRLPDAIARRVGEPGFTAEHAQVLVPLVQDEKALANAAELVGQRHKWHARPMLADEFRDEVYRELKRSGKVAQDSYQFLELRSSNAKVRKAFNVAPVVNLGGGVKTHLMTPELRVAIRDAKAKEAKKRESGATRSRSHADYALESKLDKAAEEALHAKIPAAVKGVLDAGPKVLALLLAVDLNHGLHDNALLDTLSRASGLATAEVRKFNASGKRADAAEKLVKKDPPGALRLLTASALWDATGSWQSRTHEALQRSWLGTTFAEQRAAAKARLKGPASPPPVAVAATANLVVAAGGSVEGPAEPQEAKA